MRTITFFFSLFMLLLLASNASAQIQNGTIKGTVSDPSGAVLSGVEVTLDNSLNGFYAVVTSAELGEYLFDNVPFGSYLLRASADGFQGLGQTVNVRSNLPLVLNLKLGLAGINESINIVADEPPVQPAATHLQAGPRSVARFFA